jgi:GTP cyclohydrolase-4
MRAAVSNKSSKRPKDGPHRRLSKADLWTIVGMLSTARRRRAAASAVVRASVSSLSPTRRRAVSSFPRATLADVQAIGSSTALSALDGRGDDVQARAPRIQVGLSRVGVTGVEKVIHIRDELFFARLECFVDLSREQKGAHMSRFEEVVNEAIGEVVLSESPFRAETLAQQIAELVRTRQQAERAEVTIAARYPEHKPAPVSGIQTQEIYTLHGRAVAYAHGTRRTVGVSATGMTACPCAQELIAGRARERLLADGFDEQQIERIFDRVPVATHNQRGLATLQIGCIEECVEQIDAATLLAIAESSMSSEIYELMKRTDEVAVVEKAHRRPRFVEDCVREMVAGVVRELPQLDGRNFVSARQENLETIHQHNVVAERHGTLAELRSEIETGELPPRQTSLEQWLDAGRQG